VRLGNRELRGNSGKKRIMLPLPEGKRKIKAVGQGTPAVRGTLSGKSQQTT
jgi:hypothetical protein